MSKKHWNIWLYHGIIALLCLLHAAPGRAQAKLNTAPFTENFDAGVNTSVWTIANTPCISADTGYTGLAGDQALKVNISGAAGSANVTHNLDVTQVSNATSLVRLRISALVKAQNIAQPPASYNGIKMMLHTHDPVRGDLWPQATPNGSVFPINYAWKEISFVTYVPAGATSAALVLGLEATTGTVWFDNVKVTVTALAGDVMFSENFDGSGAQQTIQSWPGYNSADMALIPGYGGTGYGLKVAIPYPSTGTASVVIPLNANRICGARIEVKAFLKADSIVLGPNGQSFNGVKMMLHTTNGTTHTWPQAVNVNGTYDWTSNSFVATVPQDTTQATLTLGLENAGGDIRFDSVQVSIKDMPRVRPAIPATTPADWRHPAGVSRLRGAMVTYGMDPASAAVLGGWNANLARYQLNWIGGDPEGAPNLSDITAYEKWLGIKADGTVNTADPNCAIVRLDGFLATAKANRFMVVVDLHAVCGYSRDAYGQYLLFQQPQYQTELIHVWDVISKHCNASANSSVIWGYDIANEPFEGDYSGSLLSWHDLATQVAQKIRLNDTTRAIIIEPANAAPSEFAFFNPVAVSGVVYSFHFYQPTGFTHQGVNPYMTGASYPDTTKGWTKASLLAGMQPALDFKTDLGVPMYVGEFGCLRWAGPTTTPVTNPPSTLAAPTTAQAVSWMTDVRDLLEASQLDWSYHAFREFSGWDIEMNSDPANSARVFSWPGSPSDRMNVICATLQQNTKPTF